MKFSELMPGNCYSYRRTDKNKNAPKVYTNILSHNKKMRRVRATVVSGGYNFEHHIFYKKDEEMCSIRPITFNFFKKQLEKSEDFMTGVKYKFMVTHTVIKEKI